METGFDNRISLHKLEVFCLIVELGGVGRAAEHLFVAQPVVTAHLRSLEERLGTRLFYRDGRRMRLTESGERAYAWARETLSRTRELVREIDGLADGRRGSIVIAASMSIGSYSLPPILSEFRRTRPQADITLHVSDPERATAAAEAAECDFAVIVAETEPEGQLFDSELLGYEPVVLVAAPDAEPHSRSIYVSELATLPMITAPRSQIRRTIVDHQLLRHGVEPSNITIELGHPEAMKRAAQDALGSVLMLRSSVTRELEAGSLREVGIEDAEIAVPVYALQLKRKRMTMIQQELRSAVREGLGRKLAQDAPAPARRRQRKSTDRVPHPV